ncbi:nucleotidyltransferase family protein [Novosphingobium sp.]|uniref:nucleotidyltransferase domain-containing protein n=1 Tax=Novosphingobium sp. TaxID=1874826 RepID=UPI0035AE6C28
MNLPALRRILLDLAGTGPTPDLAQLTEAAWAELDRIAGQHRLRPLLHAAHRDNPAIPTAIADTWRAAHRDAALVGLLQQADLAAAVRMLEAAGFAPVALKGAWLAAHAYPEAAQRPMRDIDLLVAPEHAIPAFEALLAAGYTQPVVSELSLADVLRFDKHMPPLISPRGTMIELHHRMWERDGRLDHATPEGNEDAVRARAVIDERGIRFPAGEDMLAHLIIHAIYSHRLDCGPLLLSDIDYLLRRETIDWPQFWARAAREHWRDGARLVLELVAHWRKGASIDFSADPGPSAPAALLASAPDMLLQELTTRRSAGVLAVALKDGVRGLAQRITGKRAAKGEEMVTREMDHEGGAMGWAASRSWRTLTELARADVRRQSRGLAALSKWLDA